MSKVTSVIVIPAYRPDEKLVKLLDQLRLELNVHHLNDSCKIVVVSDGNNASDLSMLNEENLLNIDIIYHAINLGKGRSLKTAFNHCLVKYPNCEYFVTADADGQHLPTDIMRILISLSNSPKVDLILGCREFRKNVPLRSSLGNSLTSFIFKYCIGLKIKDTQTGLRGFKKSSILQILQLSGERYEYETNILLAAKDHSWVIKEMKIETLYIENNKSSHFNPLVDSMRIYFLIFRFAGSSIVSSIIDFFVFQYLNGLGFSIIKATFGSRFISGWFNFALNKKLVFKSSAKIINPIIRYWSLVLVMGFLSSKLTEFIFNLGVNLLFSKILSETVLFIASFSIQKEFIFKSSSPVVLTEDE